VTAPPAKRSSPRPAAAPVEPTRLQRGFLAAAFHRPPAWPASPTPEPEATVARPRVPLATPATATLDRVVVQRAPADPPVQLPKTAVGAPIGAGATTAPPPRPVAVTPVPTVVQREARDVVPMPLPPPPVPAPTTVSVQTMHLEERPSTGTAPAPPAADPPGAAPVVARAGETAAPAGTSAGPAGAAPGGATDVEALAQRLFHPMLRRMKAELLLDRERRGMRTDAW